MIAQTKEAVSAFSDGEFTMGDVGAAANVGLGALSTFLDPAGALVGAALGPLLDWVAANVDFVKKPLDWLAGDPPAIEAQAEMWHATSVGLADHANQHVAMVQGDLPSWSGENANIYQDISKDLNETFIRSSKVSETVAEITKMAGSVVAVVREVVWMVIKELVISLVTNAVIAAAAAIPSLGSSIAAYTAWAASKVAIVMGKVTKTLSKMCMKLSRLTRKIGPLSRAFAKAGQALSRMAAKYGQMAARNKAINADAKSARAEARSEAARADSLSDNAHTAGNPADRQADITNAREASRNASRQGTDYYGDVDKPVIPGQKGYTRGKGGVNAGSEQYDDTDTDGSPAEDIERL